MQVYFETSHYDHKIDMPEPGGYVNSPGYNVCRFISSHSFLDCLTHYTDGNVCFKVQDGYQVFISEKTISQ